MITCCFPNHGEGMSSEPPASAAWPCSRIRKLQPQKLTSWHGFDQHQGRPASPNLASRTLGLCAVPVDITLGGKALWNVRGPFLWVGISSWKGFVPSLFFFGTSWRESFNCILLGPGTSHAHGRSIQCLIMYVRWGTCLFFSFFHAETTFWKIWLKEHYFVFRVQRNIRGRWCTEPVLFARVQYISMTSWAQLVKYVCSCPFLHACNQASVSVSAS